MTTKNHGAGCTDRGQCRYIGGGRDGGSTTIGSGPENERPQGWQVYIEVAEMHYRSGGPTADGNQRLSQTYITNGARSIGQIPEDRTVDADPSMMPYNTETKDVERRSGVV